MPINYTKSMIDMLDWFEEQPSSCATVVRIADGTGYTRATIRNNLQSLSGGGYAKNVYETTGEYLLVEDPREVDGPAESQQHADVALEEAIDDIVDAMTVLTSLARYDGEEYIMTRAYLRRRLQEFAADAENSGGVLDQDPEEDPWHAADAEEIVAHLQDELQAAD